MKSSRRRRILCIFLTCFILFIALTDTAQAAAIRRGDRGETVKKMQQKLRNWGYYTGSVDGVFGAQTESAVRYFQRKNGLTVDGIVGPATAKAMGLTLPSGSGGSSSQTSTSSGDVYLLARCIYGEARGESYRGQVAVGAVILNRVKSSSFPSSISGVIYQPGAFSVVADGQINLTPNSTAIQAAKDAMNGWDPTNGCLYYYNPKKTSNKWMLSRPIVATIGNHVFCR